MVARPRKPRRRAWLLAPLAALLLAACAGSDFPEPTDPVTLIPWPDFELLRYDITDQRDLTLGTVDMEVRRVGDVYELRLLFLLPDTQVRDEVFVTVDRRTLRPIRYSRLALDPDNRIEVTGVYREGEDGLVLESVVTDNGEVDEATVELDDFSFDTDSSAWLWRTIAFAQDFEVTYNSVNTVQQRTQLVRLSVVGQDLLQVPAGDYLAWQIEVRPGLDRQNVWYEVDAPHRLVRWDLEPRRYRLREIVTDPADAGS